MEKDTPLRALRKSRGLTLQDVAVAVGSDVGNISRVERGKQTSTDLAQKLVEYFGSEITEVQILYPGRFGASA